MAMGVGVGAVGVLWDRRALSAPFLSLFLSLSVAMFVQCLAHSLSLSPPPPAWLSL